MTINTTCDPKLYPGQESKLYNLLLEQFVKLGEELCESDNNIVPMLHFLSLIKILWLCKR